MERDAQRMNEQIARDVKIARIHAEEELQSMIDGLDRSNETLEEEMERDAQRMNEQIARDVKIARIHAEEELQSMIDGLDRSNETLEDFIHMGSKEEAERLKRKGLSLEQESVKKLKTSEEVAKEAKSPDEVPEEKLYDTCGVHHVTAKDKEIFMLVEKEYPLRKSLAIGMISYKLQVENYSRMENDLIPKIYKIASTPRQQVIEFPLAEEVPTTSEESCHCQKKREATAVKIVLLLKSRRNCQSKSDVSYANVDGILIDGASWLINVNTRESAKSTALGAAVTRTGDTTIVGGLKYSSNIDSEGFLFERVTNENTNVSFCIEFTEVTFSLVG
nr:hypothetical protein [Tanacetum cinerariifolium]